MVKLIAPYSVTKVENSTLEECIDYCKRKNVLVIDTETRPKPEFRGYKKAGLDPYMSEIVMFQIGDQHQQFVIDTRFIDITQSAVMNLLTDISKIKILVNAKFDYKQIYTDFGVRLNNIHDLMVQEMSLHQGIQNFGFSLEKMSQRYIGTKFRKTSQLDLFSKKEDDEEILVSKETRKEFFSIGDRPFSYNQISYGGKDVELPALIYPLQLQLLKKNNTTALVDLENKFTLVLADMELAGFHLDEDMWVELYKNNLVKRDKALKRLVEITTTHEDLSKFKNRQTSLFENSRVTSSVNINWSSNPQIVDVCKALGIPTKQLDRQKSKEADEAIYKDSVEERFLLKYKDKFPFIEQFLLFRRYEKATSTYGTGFLSKSLHPVIGRVCSTYRQILNSGRMASRDPNLQNIPNEYRVPGFRECFRSPVGKKLIVADYSGQELRILADYANEDVMIEALNAGEDLHSLTASKVYSIIRGHDVIVSKTENSDLRAYGKTLNFGIAYGMSAYKLSNDFGISIKEAEKVIDAFYEAYPNLKSYFEKAQEGALTLGYILIDPVIKRKSYLGKYWERYKASKLVIDSLQESGSTKRASKSVWSDYFTYKGMIERKSQNYPIQGTGANISKLAACILRKYQADNNAWSLFKIVNMVHDEIVLEANEEDADEVKDILEKAMMKAGEVFCKKCPMVVDAVISDHWNH